MWLKNIILLLTVLLVGVLIVNPVWGTLLTCIPVLIAILLYLLGEIAGEKIVIDKPTTSIIFTKRLFMLIPRQHVILFSMVQRMYAEHKIYGKGGAAVSSTFEVSIETPGRKMARIFQSSKASDASNVAKMVGSLIGTDVYNRVEGG